MSLTLQDAQQLQGATLSTSDGSKIGKVSDVYIDNDTQQPEWALVATGLFGTRESFVPLAEGQMTPEGVTVPYDKDLVKSAPTAEPDGELSQAEESELYIHYGLSYDESASDSGLATGTSAAAAGVASERTDGAGTDDAMTRSEERLRVGVVRRPSQTVRLKKRIVSENVTTTVPVSSERTVVNREPITDANRDRSLDGPEITEAEHEVVLHAERPVVDKETVPVERVRLDVDTVTEQESVSESVRKEVIETEGVDDR